MTDFIRDWRARQGSAATGKTFVPLEFALGESFQFDGSDEGVVVGGIYLILSAS